jgi:hypothetical protein
MNNHADYEIETSELGTSIYANLIHGGMIIQNSLF